MEDYLNYIGTKVKQHRKINELASFEICNGKCRQWLKKSLERSTKVVR